jgi:protein involved in polysaccharide export with SLBB domain
VNPGTYEILPGETLGDILPLAGGLSPTARPSELRILRLDEENRYVEATLDVGDPLDLLLQAGDRVSIPSTIDTRERILVEGALFGEPLSGEEPTSIPTGPIRVNVPFRPGISLLDVLDRLGGPTPYAESRDSYIVRQSGERLPLPDLRELWDAQDQTRDVLLEAGDRLIIPIMRLDVSVAGEVNSPTTVAFQEGQTVSDYIALAGGIDPDTGSKNRVFFLDADGRRRRTGFDAIVPPGSTIFVPRNPWARTQQVAGNVFIVTGWVTTLVTFLSEVFGISVAELIGP